MFLLRCLAPQKLQIFAIATPQNRILVALKGSIQNLQQASPSFKYESPSRFLIFQFFSRNICRCDARCGCSQRVTFHPCSPEFSNPSSSRRVEDSNPTWKSDYFFQVDVMSTLNISYSTRNSFYFVFFQRTSRLHYPQRQPVMRYKMTITSMKH